MTISTAISAGGTKQGVILAGAVRDVYSQEILLNAQPVLLFAQFVDRRTELGREPGDTIKFTKYADLTGDSALSEVENIGVTNLESSMVHIGVDEHGKGVGFSERLARTAWDNIAGLATRQLGVHYGKSVDKLCRNAFRAAGSLQTFFPAAGIANRSALTSAHTLSVLAIKDAVERLATNKAPKIGGNYVCIVHPHQARGLRDDDEWVEAHKYASPGEIFRGEIGMMEGVRFVETTNISVVKAATGVVMADGVSQDETQAVFNASLDVYQAILMGANGVGWAEGLPVEFRDNGVIDFGRQRELAWYSIMGAGEIRPENVTAIETV
jgi:N4-gp56 family major capsid protein